MKWLVGLFAVWVVLRGRGPLYMSFASSDYAAAKAKADGAAAGNAVSSVLQNYFDLMK